MISGMSSFRSNVTTKMRHGVLHLNAFPSIGPLPLNSNAKYCLNIRAVSFMSSPDVDKDGMDLITKEELQKRHSGIIMDKRGISRLILPDDKVIKTNQKTGAKRQVYTSRNFGYFWDLKDLKLTNNKPIISNTSLIKKNISKIFPSFGNVTGSNNLVSLDGEIATFPDFFTRQNRLKDPEAQCTLVAINFNDFGYKMLNSWTVPFQSELMHSNTNKKNKDRAEIVMLSINEGIMLSFLQRFIRSALQKHVLPSQHPHSFTYFSKDCSTLRDVLRMHNNKTAYVFLLDGLARVRFAGSGEASEEEARNLISFAKELVPKFKVDEITSDDVSLDTATTPTKNITKLRNVNVQNSNIRSRKKQQLRISKTRN